MKKEEPKNTYNIKEDIKAWEKKHGKVNIIDPPEIPKQLR